MRLTCNKTGNGTTYYIIRSIKRDGRRSSEVVERLGTEAEIMEKHRCTDALAWARSYLEGLNSAEKEKKGKVLVPFSTNTLLPEGEQRLYNIGYLFLQQIYCGLRIPSICRKISRDHGFAYDLDAILSRLVYGRILYPSSKLTCCEQSQTLFERPEFEPHQVYRALSVLSEESERIQAELYENSRKLCSRRTGILYYDCTNYFFESETARGIKQYGISKEHRPNPIVQMGLFMDGSGIPLAFCINPGDTNEQVTMTPLEKRIMSDFSLSRFIVCTDAGLSSAANRRFNNFGGRCFITTQSIRKMKKRDQDECLSPAGWRLEGDCGLYDIGALEDNEENRGKTFYRELYIEGYDEERDISFDQTVVVTYSLKYRDYQRAVRNQQIERALKAVASGQGRLDRHNQNDYRRFIKKTCVTSDGEVAGKKIYEIDRGAIEKEERFDGFYAVATNLEDSAGDIIRVNRGRWEIEESFRIMKSEFRARPVYLSRDDRIKAHFLTCFMALLVYRILEKKLGRGYSCRSITDTLKGMNIAVLGEEGYMPVYTRTGITDALHGAAGFRTDYEFIGKRQMQGICSLSKK